MESGGDPPPDQLQKNQNPDHFNAAAGGGGTAADKHQKDQNHLTEGRPQIKIIRRKTGGSDNGRSLENRIAQGLSDAAVKSAKKKVCRDEDGGSADNKDIKAEFRIPENGRKTIFSDI